MIKAVLLSLPELVALGAFIVAIAFWAGYFSDVIYCLAC
jgi:hypothetical protein